MSHVAGVVWNIFQGDPLTIRIECLDDDEAIVDITDYDVGINLVWGTDDDERLEFVTGDMTITSTEGYVECPVTATQIENLPLGARTDVFLILDPPDDDQYTALLGKIKVRDA